MVDGVIPGRGVGCEVPVGTVTSGVGLRLQALRNNASNPLRRRLLSITILIIEKRKSVNACQSEQGMLN